MRARCTGTHTKKKERLKEKFLSLVRYVREEADAYIYYYVFWSPVFDATLLLIHPMSVSATTTTTIIILLQTVALVFFVTVDLVLGSLYCWWWDLAYIMRY